MDLTIVRAVSIGAAPTTKIARIASAVTEAALHPTRNASTSAAPSAGRSGRHRVFLMTSLMTWTATVATLCLATLPAANGIGQCELPSEWQGEWFQSDRAHLGPVVVSRHNFSSAGTCIEKGKSNRYLIREESYASQEKFSCYKCMVINMKHRNVIQYKESFCDPQNQDLVSLCHGITGDAMLFSMFRLSAAPVTCPFRGPLTFTYSRNLQECAHPVSQVDSCADDSRLLLRFQACADVPGSESFEEELVCLGAWEEGMNHYLVGKINHTHANSDNDRYRCFIYEREAHPEIPGATLMYLAQSADATCQGLISAYEGGKTMKLTKANQGSKKCKLPWWFVAHNHWHTLDYSQSYYIYHRNTSLRISNGTSAPSDPEVRGHTDLRLVCHEYFTDDRHNRKHRRQHQPPRHGGADTQDTGSDQWSGSSSSSSGSVNEDNPHGADGKDWGPALGAGGSQDPGGVGEDGDLGSPRTSVSEVGYLPHGDFELNADGERVEHSRAEAVQHKRGHHNKRSVTIVVHVTVGCRTGYWCMRIHRRANHVVQVETGDLAYRAEEACLEHYWNPGKAALTTLVARDEQSRSCGPLGRYLVGPDALRPPRRHEPPNTDCNANNMPAYARLNVGCTAHDTLELEASCPLDDVTTYQCHGRWDSEGVTYVVASPTSRPSGTPRRVCFAYSALGGTGEVTEGGVRSPPTMTLTARHDTCSPVTRDAHITLNATLTGPCAEASSIASGSPSHLASTYLSLASWLPLLAFSFVGSFLSSCSLVPSNRAQFVRCTFPLRS